MKVETSGNAKGMSNRRFALLALSCVLVPLLILALGTILYPEILWDEFLYPYFWGPVVSDAQERLVSGIGEGYNPVSTLTYALLLAISLLAFYLIAKRAKLKVDEGLVLASVPLMLFGGMARALEDAQLYQGWLSYLFISPLIYFVVGALFVMAVVIGQAEERGKISRGTMYLLFVALLSFIVVFYIGASQYWDLLRAGIGVVLAILLAISSLLGFHLLIRRNWSPVRASVLCIGMFTSAFAALHLALFTIDADWRAQFPGLTGDALAPHPYELIIIPGLALALTLLLVLIGRTSKEGWISLLAVPVNALMFFAQFLDGVATARGMEIFGYGEKHFLPTFLIDATGTAWIMVPLKFALVLAIIWVLDIAYRKELAKYPNLANIIKLGVIFLGLAPGVRDTIRIALGI